MPEGRVKLYKVRRYMGDGTYQWLAYPAGDMSSCGWVDDKIDGTPFTQEEAKLWRATARELQLADENPDVIYHAVVEA